MSAFPINCESSLHNTQTVVKFSSVHSRKIVFRVANDSSLFVYYIQLRENVCPTRMYWLHDKNESNDEIESTLVFRCRRLIKLLLVRNIEKCNKSKYLCAANFKIHCDINLHFFGFWYHERKREWKKRTSPSSSSSVVRYVSTFYFTILNSACKTGFTSASVCVCVLVFLLTFEACKSSVDFDEFWYSFGSYAFLSLSSSLLTVFSTFHDSEPYIPTPSTITQSEIAFVSLYVCTLKYSSSFNFSIFHARHSFSVLHLIFGFVLVVFLRFFSLRFYFTIVIFMHDLFCEYWTLNDAVKLESWS